MVLGGCGFLLTIFIGRSFWLKHDKTKKPWGDVWGIAALICVALIAWSVLALLYVGFINLN